MTIWSIMEKLMPLRTRLVHFLLLDTIAVAVKIIQWWMMKSEKHSVHIVA